MNCFCEHLRSVRQVIIGSVSTDEICLTSSLQKVSSERFVKFSTSRNLSFIETKRFFYLFIIYLRRANRLTPKYSLSLLILRKFTMLPSGRHHFDDSLQKKRERY